MKENFLLKAYTNRVKEQILGLGADLVGIADVESLSGLKTIPENILDGFTKIISIAISLPVATFERIIDRPTPDYSATYQTANRILDEIAFKTAIFLQKDGYSSLPIQASQILDKKTWRGAISHKATARVAGIGWQGKNLLLITPQYGSRVRLVTILTNAPLIPDKPLKNRCGKCTNCMDACPAGAIKGVSTKDHYENRNQAIHLSKCVEKLTLDFASDPDIGVPICGICINVCPFGRKR